MSHIPRLRVRLGDLLVEEGVITEDQLNTALDQQESTGQKLGSALQSLGFIQEHELLLFLSKQLELPLVDLRTVTIDPMHAQMVPASYAIRNSALVLSKQGQEITVGLGDPANINAVSTIEDLLTNYSTRYVVVSERQLADAYQALFKNYSDKESALEQLKRNSRMSSRLTARLGDILIETGVITEEQLNQALDTQQDTQEKLGYILIKMGLLTDFELSRLLSKQLQLPLVDIRTVRLQSDTVYWLSRESALKHRTLVLRGSEQGVTVGMSDPANLLSVDAISTLLQPKNVEFVVVSEKQLTSALEYFYNTKRDDYNARLNAQGEFQRPF